MVGCREDGALCVWAEGTGQGVSSQPAKGDGETSHLVASLRSPQRSRDFKLVGERMGQEMVIGSSVQPQGGRGPQKDISCATRSCGRY